MVQFVAPAAFTYPPTQVQSAAFFDSVNRVVENSGQDAQILFPVPVEYVPFKQIWQEFVASSFPVHPALQVHAVMTVLPASEFEFAGQF